MTPVNEFVKPLEIPSWHSLIQSLKVLSPHPDANPKYTPLLLARYQ